MGTFTAWGIWKDIGKAEAGHSCSRKENWKNSAFGPAILLLLDFQQCKVSWRCLLLEDNLTEGGNCRQGARAQHEQRSHSSWQLFPEASPTQLCGLPKAFEKAQASPQVSPISPNPSSELHSSCPAAQARSSGASPTACLLEKIVKKKQSLSRRSIPCPSQSSRGAPVSFFLIGTSATLSSTAFPAPSLALQPAFPSCTTGFTEDFATHCTLTLLPGAQKDRGRLRG